MEQQSPARSDQEQIHANATRCQTPVPSTSTNARVASAIVTLSCATIIASALLLRMRRQRRPYERLQFTSPRSWEEVVDNMPNNFYSRFRMDPADFNALFEQFPDGAFDRVTNAGGASAACEPRCILACLVMYCAGSRVVDISDCLQQSVSTVYRNIGETRKIFVKNRHLFIPKNPFDSQEKLEELAKGFNEMTYRYKDGCRTMQNCIGAIDGMLQPVTRQLSISTDHLLYNVKTPGPAINMQAICDSRYRFTMVEIHTPGGTHDSLAFDSTGIGEQLHGLARSTERVCKFWFAADCAYTLTRNVLIPYRSPRNGAEGRKSELQAFNEKLSSLRVVVEQAFGMLKGKWRILQMPLKGRHIQTVCDILLVCTCLHNFCIDRDVEPPRMTAAARAKTVWGGSSRSKHARREVLLSGLDSVDYLTPIMVSQISEKSGIDFRRALTQQLAEDYTYRPMRTLFYENQRAEARERKRRRQSTMSEEDGYKSGDESLYNHQTNIDSNRS